jgi:hypothetical protein
MRFTENEYSAATGYKNEYGVVAMGFPFETIILSDQRTKLMKAVIQYLKL